MFCSASDQGGSSMVNCYPGAFSGSRCIRVGSCSASDVPSVWVDPGQVDFLLPGENLAVRNSDGIPEPQTGSSFATAVAAGLAGLILYCSLRLKIPITPSAESSQIKKADEDYREEDGGSDNEKYSQGEEEPMSPGNQDRQPYSVANDRRDHGQNGTDGLIHWRREPMYKVFRNMSTLVGLSSGAYQSHLTKPEKFFLSELKDELGKRKGKKIKGFDKLEWDDNFDAVLREILEKLSTRASHEEGFTQ